MHAVGEDIKRKGDGKKKRAASQGGRKPNAERQIERLPEVGFDGDDLEAVERGARPGDEFFEKLRLSCRHGG